MRIFKAAYRKALLGNMRAEQLKRNSDELQVRVLELIEELSASNRYSAERIGSTHTYPQECRPIEEQIMSLAKLFGLDPRDALTYAKTLPKLPEGAEGHFAYVSFEEVAKMHFPDISHTPAQYCQFQNLIIQMLSKSRRFFNYYKEAEINPASLRMQAHTAWAHSLLQREQKGGILIVAGQLGLLHRGCSDRLSLEVIVNTPGEFAFDGIMGGCVLITHPERLWSQEDLGMSCPGAEFKPKRSIRPGFSRVPFFNFHSGELMFGAHGDDNFLPDNGAASGFLS